MNKPEIWHALDVTVESAAAEAIEFGLNELGADGTEINNLGKTQSETVCVTGYFETEPNEKTARDELVEALRIYDFAPAAIREIVRREIENTDWLAEWKKHWRPTETARFIIAPTWEKFDAPPEKIVIRIEPSMAFGTGTHETTQLCLKAIEENYRNGETFLDVGTGTGILAIAARKFKVQSSKFKVVGCDTDADSIKIARENAELNDANEIEFYVGSIDENTARFDFVCANLTIDVIIPILPLLLEKTKRILVLSGILKEQENQIVEELKKLQITDYKIETLGMWISVTVISRQ
jgi:ribosomal protein L11 methyltransferase